MHQQSLIAQVTPLKNIPAASKVFMVARYAHAQNPTLSADRPHTPVPANKGVLHF
jgi:hypothetical protein